jgi:hypothetical protein
MNDNIFNEFIHKFKGESLWKLNFLGILVLK